MNIPQKATQCKQILAYIDLHGSITPLEALEYCGCFRLSARIKDLRDDGYSIVTVREKKNGKSYARYFLEEENDDNYF